MKSAIKWFFIAAVVGCLAMAHSSAQTTWSIAITKSPYEISCLKKKISVPAANSCASAIVVAQGVFNSGGSCDRVCPGQAALLGTPTCVQPSASTFQVSIPYVCAPVDPPAPQCDEPAVISKNGEVVLPADATDIEDPVDVDEDRGLLSDLYPGRDTTAGLYPLGCEPSIGGTLPAEVDEQLEKDVILAETHLSDFETTMGTDIAKTLNGKSLRTFKPLAAVPVGQCFIIGKKGKMAVPCDSSLFLRSGQPFEGRDIIYVHGLATGQITKWIGNYQPAKNLWPQNAAEFLDANGYFRKYAEDYWQDHIRENLFDPDNPSSTIAGWQWTSADSSPRYNPKSNRYLLVSWSSNQTIEFAQHALLRQILLAISTNKNVVTPPTYPSNHVRPFCSNGCIIIGHSTGPLITSSALGRAAAGHFGPGGQQVVKLIRTHVSFEGAISGSRLASIGMAIGLAVSGTPHSLCTIFDDLLGVTDTCIGDTSFLAQSILRDLMPVVSQGVWGSWVDKSPVPTVTVAGGHPTGNFTALTKFMLPGLDDGVVSMNSACGNPNPVFPLLLAPSGIMVTNPVAAFDMSKDAGLLARAIANFPSHFNFKGGFPSGVGYLAGACTPHLSPTGMVMPVLAELAGTPWDTRKRYSNHYSFLQGTIDHAYDGGTDNGNKWPSEMGNPASTNRRYFQSLGIGPNVEETSAVTDNGIYAQAADGTYLVHPSFNKMHEIVRGRKISFKLFGKKRTIWVWKRVYHLLDKWETKQSSHYVYEFVGRR